MILISDFLTSIYFCLYLSKQIIDVDTFVKFLFEFKFFISLIIFCFNFHLAF